jgi:radical SAM protein
MPHPLSFASLDFATTPFLVIWEVTQACGLACQHCRAEAIDQRDPRELTTEEGKDLLHQIKEMGTPVCVLSGGDPLQRDDLAELVRHGQSLGLRMATIPAATDRLTRERLAELKQAGLAQVAFSLDGSTAELHDGFRQVPGTYAKTMQAVEWAHELGIPVQINTTFARYNRHDVDALLALVERLGVVFWEVFSLVPVGRGTVLPSLDAAEHEALFAKLYELSQRVSFVIKVTEAPHYRRYVLHQRAKEGRGGMPPQGHPGGRLPVHSGSAVPAQLSRELSTHESFGMRAKGINSGKGFCFVSHQGEVMPSGFFPRAVGDIRERPLSAIYRESELFLQLRDPKLLKGRCGRCELADVCGGSRARAWAVHDDWFAEDPACLYDPPHRA